MIPFIICQLLIFVILHFLYFLLNLFEADKMEISQFLVISY